MHATATARNATAAAMHATATAMNATAMHAKAAEDDGLQPKRACAHWDKWTQICGQMCQHNRAGTQACTYLLHATGSIKICPDAQQLWVGGGTTLQHHTAV
jgi:hypothetical protein